MTSLIAIPFLIGSVPIGLAVVGANHFLKDKRKTHKFLYWGGITASAFGGWVVSNMLMTRYVGSEVFSAEDMNCAACGTWEAAHKMDITTTAMCHRCVGKKAESFSAEEKKIVELLVEMDNNSMVDGNVEYIIDLINKAGMNILSVKDMNAESFSAERTEPYYGRGGLDFGRDTKGRFRRKLVTPIEDKEYGQGMLTREIKPLKDRDFFGMPHYFYRWIGGRSSGNPIYYGYPGGTGLNEPKLIHYVHPLYDEDYVKTLADNLNTIGFAS